MANRGSSRKKRKPRPKKRSQPAAFDQVAVAKKADKDLREKNFRRAREGYRRLIRADADLYTPLYLQATLGYVKELLAGGRLQQVEDVLSQARALASEHLEGINLLEIRIAKARGHWSEARTLAIALWEGSDHGQALDPETRSLVADALILSFEPVVCSDDTLAQEAKTIHDALRALSEGDQATTDALLRPLARQSLFAEWKLLIKGLNAFYARDGERAAVCFERLKADSVPGRAAKAFHSLRSLSSDVGDGSNPPNTALMCHLMGHQDAAAYMPAVQESWESERLDRAFRLLQTKQEAFPSTAPGFWGRLTDLFLYCAPVSQNAYMGMARRLMRTVHSRNFRHDAEKAALCRWAALEEIPIENVKVYVSVWEDFLAAYETSYGSHDRLASRVHAKIAHDVLEKAGGRRRRSPEFAIVMEQAHASLARDENYCPVYLDLLQAYAAAGMTRERNRLLDQLTKRFPGEKKILLEAARRCVERRSHVKGMGMLRAALAVDPLDSAIIATIVEALGEQAFDYYKKDDLKRGRACFEEMKPHLVDNLEDFDRGRVYQLIKQTVFEHAYVKGNKCIDPTRQAAAAAPRDTIDYARMVTAAIYYPRDRRLKDRIVWPPNDVFSHPDGANAVRIVKLLKRHQANLQEERLHSMVSVMQQYLRDAIEGCQIDPLAARGLILEQHDFRYDLFADEVIAAGLKQEPDDLFLQIAACGTASPDDVSEDDVDRLRSLLKRLEQTRDRQAIDYGRSKLRQLESEVAARDEGFGWLPDDIAFAVLDEEEPDVVTEEWAELEEKFPGVKFVLEQLAAMNPRERERYRKEVGLPRRDFEELIHVAETLKEDGALSEMDSPPAAPAPRPSFPPPRRKPPSPRKPTEKPSSNQDQLDLFLF